MKRVLYILLVIAVIGGSWLLYSHKRQAAEAQRPEGIETVAVERGAIEGLVSTTGSLKAERSQRLTFSMAGRVAEVLAEKGDMVEADQVLARLDGSDLRLNLRQAEAALQLNEAQLSRTLKGASEEEIASAEAALASAKANLQDLRKGATEREKELAQLSIDQAKNSLWSAQASRDAICGRVGRGATEADCDSAEAQVLNAEVAVGIAETKYEQLLEPPKASAVASAEAQIAQAESTLEQLMSNPSAEDIAISEAQVRQAQVSVDMAREKLEDLVLCAPFAGQLAAWELNPEELVSAGTPVGTLIDARRYHISVNIDETEIGQVAVGQKVHISLDAFPGEDIVGRVSQIDLAGESVQGLVVYGVRIDIEDTDLPLKPLMTAAVDIVVEKKDGVLLVPNRALRRDEKGKYVEVLENNVPTRLAIETGISDDERTEIVSGLEEGQEVIVTRPQESLLGGRGLFGGD
ncbi:MAG: efflux RND transporter periplasmic adaptor subunit [Chloroflexota bacterium]|nr:efflux RND transporter periplasmic adaptor subunit [Chloroflexota bacterium]